MSGYKELEAIRSHLVDLCTTVTRIRDPKLFSNLLIQAKLVDDMSAESILTMSGTSHYHKVSALVSRVASTIESASSQKRATEIFDQLVLILKNDLELRDIAEQLEKYVCKTGILYKDLCMPYNMSP